MVYTDGSVTKDRTELKQDLIMYTDGSVTKDHTEETRTANHNILQCTLMVQSPKTALKKTANPHKISWYTLMAQSPKTVLKKTRSLIVH